MKKAETIMEILAAYDLTHSFRDAAELVGCAPNTVARYVRGRDAGELVDQPRGSPEDSGHGFNESRRHVRREFVSYGLRLAR